MSRLRNVPFPPNSFLTLLSLAERIIYKEQRTEYSKGIREKRKWLNAYKHSAVQARIPPHEGPRERADGHMRLLRPPGAEVQDVYENARFQPRRPVPDATDRQAHGALDAQNRKVLPCVRKVEGRGPAWQIRKEKVRRPRMSSRCAQATPLDVR